MHSAVKSILYRLVVVQQNCNWIRKYVQPVFFCFWNNVDTDVFRIFHSAYQSQIVNDVLYYMLFVLRKIVYICYPCNNGKSVSS
jgi:hypothetical protein